MKRLAVILMLLVPASAFADAPETATVSGTIVDPGGSALPGVSVTLSSGRGDKFTVTDENGQYRFVGVVPDTYDLKAELEGLGDAQANFHAAAGDRKSVDLTLQAAVEGGVVDVTAQTPMVDKFNVTAGSTVTSEIGEQTAGTTRTYYGVINALPGVTADAENDDIQQTRPSVNGTHFADQGVYVDGVDTTFAKFGGSRVFLPTTAVTEVSMEAGGSSAEYGRYIGSSTNVIVKSGTNRWHADILWNHQRVDWGAEYKDQPSLAERRNRPYPVDWFKRCHGDERDQGRGAIPPSIVEEVSTINREACLPGSDEWAGSSDGYEFSAGGPLRRDRFWFFVGVSEFDDAYSERLLGGDPYDVSLYSDARIFKLNMQPSAAHSFAASAIDTPAFRNYFNWQSYDYWTPTPHENDSVLSTVSWNWAISGNWFLEAKLADQETQENKFLACHDILEQDNPAAQAVDGIPILEWLSQDNYRDTPARMVETCLQAKSLDRGPIAGHTATNTSGGDTSYPLRFPFDPSKGIFYPGNNYNVYRDAENLSSWHNGWILSDGFGFNAFPREQANIGLTQFVGANHELKYGFDYQDTKWEGENARVPLLQGWGFDPTNPFGFLGAGTIADDTCATPFTRTGTSPIRGRTCYFTDHNSTFLTCEGNAPDGMPHRPTTVEHVNGEVVRTTGTCVGRGSGDSEVRNVGFYVRDRFTIGDHWTVNMGLRAETQEAWNDVRRQVIDDTYVDPRINITYDIKGDGALLLNASWGQYHAMLNQAWISGGDSNVPSMHDLWNGYEGHEVFLFCDPADIGTFDYLMAVGLTNYGCRVPQRRDSLHNGTVGAPLPGYNLSWELTTPGLMWDAVQAGVFDYDVQTYYKQEGILGLEWQFRPNWALDVKYIEWQLQDMMFSNNQLDHKGRNIGVTGNYHDLYDILVAFDDARAATWAAQGYDPAARPATLNREALEMADPAKNSFQGVQVQLNRRFADGWALYNNLAWASTDTTGAGAWWNNTNSTYLEAAHVVLNQQNIDSCQAGQTRPDRRTGRTPLYPEDCVARLTDWLGYPASMINRRGANGTYDREWIWNTFGFRTWRLGNQDLTLGGHLTFQTGTPWTTSSGAGYERPCGPRPPGIPESIPICLPVDVTDANANQRPGTSNTGVGFPLHPSGTEGRRTADEYTVNLTGAWGFPMGYRDVRGELRVEVLNATNQQRRRSWNSAGEVLPVRRFFQRPRQIRANFKIRF